MMEGVMKNGMKNVWNHLKDSICFHDFKYFFDVRVLQGFFSIALTALNSHNIFEVLSSEGASPRILHAGSKTLQITCKKL